MCGDIPGKLPRENFQKSLDSLEGFTVGEFSAGGYLHEIISRGKNFLLRHWKGRIREKNLREGGSPAWLEKRLEI